MSYDFSKLSRVPINDSVTDNTFTLVVNNDEVEKTPYGNVVSNIKDYTEDYNSYSLTHPGSSPIDFIRSLTPIRIDTQTVPRQGYLTYMYFYYTFEVFCSTNSTWYKITEVNSNQSKLTEYLYSPTRLIEQVQKKYAGANPESGTYFITPIGFEDVRIFNCSGDADISGDLYVNGISYLKEIEADSIKLKGTNKEINIDASSISLHDETLNNDITIEEDGNGKLSIDENVIVDGTIEAQAVKGNVVAPNVHIGTNSTPYIDINSTTIDFTGSNSGVQIKHDGNGNLVVAEGTSDTKITGLASPTNSSDAVNKQYVDTNVAQLNGRINNLIVGGDNTKGEEIAVLFIDGVIPSGGVATTSISLTGQLTKLISFAWAWSTNGEDIEWKCDNMICEDSSGSGTSFTLTVNCGDGPEVWFRVVYSKKANLIVPELVDLRQPFDYTGTWPPNAYSTSSSYTKGDYVTYDDEIYVCVAPSGTTVTGTWNSSYWEVVTARLNIQDGLDKRIKTDGTSIITGDLNMNNSHKIVSLAAPTNDTDAATKKYVDNKINNLVTDSITLYHYPSGAGSSADGEIYINPDYQSNVPIIYFESDFGDGSIPTRLSYVADPVSSMDAATKGYVDNKKFTLDSNGILSFG